MFDFDRQKASRADVSKPATNAEAPAPERSTSTTRPRPELSVSSLNSVRVHLADFSYRTRASDDNNLVIFIDRVRTIFGLESRLLGLAPLGEMSITKNNGQYSLSMHIGRNHIAERELPSHSSTVIEMNCLLAGVWVASGPSVRRSALDRLTIEFPILPQFEPGISLVRDAPIKATQTISFEDLSASQRNLRKGEIIESPLEYSAFGRVKRRYEAPLASDRELTLIDTRSSRLGVIRTDPYLELSIESDPSTGSKDARRVSAFYGSRHVLLHLPNEAYTSHAAKTLITGAAMTLDTLRRLARH